MTGDSGNQHKDNNMANNTDLSTSVAASCHQRKRSMVLQKDPRRSIANINLTDFVFEENKADSVFYAENEPFVTPSFHEEGTYENTSPKRL